MTHHPDHEVELFRDEDAYEVYVDLPGYERGEIGVHWHDSRLHVEAEHHEDGDTRVYNRHVSVPHEVDPEGITATYDDGVLEVNLPITDESSRPGIRIDVEE